MVVSKELTNFDCTRRVSRTDSLGQHRTEKWDSRSPLAGTNIRKKLKKRSKVTRSNKTRSSTDSNSSAEIIRDRLIFKTRTQRFDSADYFSSPSIPQPGNSLGSDKVNAAEDIFNGALEFEGATEIVSGLAENRHQNINQHIEYNTSEIKTPAPLPMSSSEDATTCVVARHLKLKARNKRWDSADYFMEQERCDLKKKTSLGRRMIAYLAT